MPLYECSQCHSVENTALADYWDQHFNWMEKPEPREAFRPLCSECLTGEWHNKFPKRSARGCRVDGGGFLWQPGEQMPGGFKVVRIVE